MKCALGTWVSGGGAHQSLVALASDVQHARGEPPKELGCAPAMPSTACRRAQHLLDAAAPLSRHNRDAQPSQRRSLRTPVARRRTREARRGLCDREEPCQRHRATQPSRGPRLAGMQTAAQVPATVCHARSPESSESHPRTGTGPLRCDDGRSRLSTVQRTDQHPAPRARSPCTPVTDLCVVTVTTHSSVTGVHVTALARRRTLISSLDGWQPGSPVIAPWRNRASSWM